MSSRASREEERILKAIEGARKVAIVRLGSIGDVVATLPFAWLLRDLLPVARLAWIAHPAEAKLLRGVAALDEVIALPRASLLRSVPSWRRILRPAGIDAVFDLHGNLKSGIVGCLTGARVRIGFQRADCREHWNPLLTNYKLPRLSSGNKTRRALEAAARLGHPAPAIRFGLQFAPEEAGRAERVLDAVSAAGSSVALLQLGRLEDVRAWPSDHFARLALAFRERGRKVLFLGGPDEVQAGEAVRGLLGADDDGIHFEVGTLTLREEGALLQALARDPAGRHLFVGQDSGSLHLAVACGLRAIGLFGPQDPERTAPVGPRFEVLFHPEAAACIPCSRRECLHPVRSFCMSSITPEEVVARAGHDGGGGPPGRTPAATAPPPVAAALWNGPAKLSRREGVAAAVLAALAFLGALAAAGLGPRLGFDEPGVLAEALRVWPCGEHLVPPPAASAGEFPGLGRLPAAIAVSLLGRTAPAAALPGALAAGATALLTYLAGRRLGGGGAGLWAGAAFLLMWGGHWHSGREAIAPLAGFLVTLSFTAFMASSDGPGSRLPLVLSGVAAGAAFAAAGVPGLCLPALAVVIFHAGEKRLGKLLAPPLLVAAAAALLVAGLWLAALALASPETLDARLLLPLAGARPHWGPPWWLLRDGLPASAAAPLALWAHLRTRRYREDLGFADRRWRFPKAALASGLALWIIFPANDPAWTLSLLPVLALIIGSWCEHARETGRARG